MIWNMNAISQQRQWALNAMHCCSLVQARFLRPIQKNYSMHGSFLNWSYLFLLLGDNITLSPLGLQLFRSTRWTLRAKFCYERGAPCVCLLLTCCTFIWRHLVQGRIVSLFHTLRSKMRWMTFYAKDQRAHPVVFFILIWLFCNLSGRQESKNSGDS